MIDTKPERVYFLDMINVRSPRSVITNPVTVNMNDCFYQYFINFSVILFGYLMIINKGDNP